MHKKNIASLPTYSKRAAMAYPLKVPPAFCARIAADLTDPLLKQILPTAIELISDPNYSVDPLVEKKLQPVIGVVHKYSGRALLLVTDQCAINCRYCFRKFTREKITDWSAALNYLAKNPSIKEVILSGGDPLTLSASQLSRITTKISAISHIKILRIHSRIPIVCPERINKKMIAAITASKLQVVLVTHCNHAREITPQVSSAVAALRKAKITVFNQSVLLQGVNDSAPTLIDLSEKLFAAGILPYYLHLLDKVRGAQHFAVNLKVAKHMQREMLTNLPGYLVPKFVYEQPGALFKISI